MVKWLAPLLVLASATGLSDGVVTGTGAGAGRAAACADAKANADFSLVEFRGAYPQAEISQFDACECSQEGQGNATCSVDGRWLGTPAATRLIVGNGTDRNQPLACAGAKENAESALTRFHAGFPTARIVATEACFCSENPNSAIARLRWSCTTNSRWSP